MAATATGLYYARNRFYSPALGRFVTRDVNATALPIITALTFNGTTVDSVIDGFAAVRHFTDGLNVFLFASANPITRGDALGLTYDDSWLDDEIDAYTGHRLYALGMINEGAKWASIGIEVALDVASTLLGIDVLESVQVVASGKGGFFEAMDIFMAVLPVGRLGKVVGKLAHMGSFLRRTEKVAHLAGTTLEHLFKILPYREARKLTRGWGGRIQAHHLIEKRFMHIFNRNPLDLPAVILTREMDQEITAALRRALPYGSGLKGAAAKARLWEVYQQVYRNLGSSEWLSYIERYFQ